MNAAEPRRLVPVQEAIQTLGAVPLDADRYVFEHRVWLSDSHGEEAYYFIVKAASLEDGRAVSHPTGSAFYAWLEEHCTRVKASWWTPERCFAWRAANLDRPRYYGTLREAYDDDQVAAALDRVTVDYATGSEIRA